VLGYILLAFYKKSVIDSIRTDIADIYFSTSFKGGISLGKTIIVNASFRYDGNTIIHEIGHCLQSRYLGPLYLLIVGGPSILRSFIWNVFKLKRSRYFDAFPESWAERLGNKYFKIQAHKAKLGNIDTKKTM
jgi:hypothetical protein